MAQVDFPKSKGNLKPAFEPIILARKPGPRVLPLGVDEARIHTNGEVLGRPETRPRVRGYVGIKSEDMIPALPPHPAGRWPANVLHDGSAEVLAALAVFGERAGDRADRKPRVHIAPPGGNGHTLNPGWSGGETPGHADTGTAARFFASCP